MHEDPVAKLEQLVCEWYEVDRTWLNDIPFSLFELLARHCGQAPLNAVIGLWRQGEEVRENARRVKAMWT